jgi:hypothetical protein
MTDAKGIDVKGFRQIEAVGAGRVDSPSRSFMEEWSSHDKMAMQSGRRLDEGVGQRREV